MAFTYVNRRGRTYYLHLRVTGAGAEPEQRRSYFNQHPEQALACPPPDYVIREVPGTGVPVLQKKGAGRGDRPGGSIDGGVPI